MKKKILESFFFIVIVGLLVKNMPYLKKYDIKLKFSIYRSIMCTFFVIKSLLYIASVNNIMDDTFIFIKELEPLFFKFYLYILFDIIFILCRSKKRYDLLIHHFVIILISTLAYNKNILGNILPILLLNEAISILSGFDKISLNNNMISQSILFKQIRKLIIIFIRLPIWIIFLNLSLKNKEILGELNSIKIISAFVGLSVIGLDLYWYGKCNEFIKKNSS